MKAVVCSACGTKMKRNGIASSGSQRWRCARCGRSRTLRYDDASRRLKEFLAWLFSKSSQCDMPGQGRTFRRRTSEFWSIWPMPQPTGEMHRVVYVDGIHLARGIVALIACSDEHVLSWYLARSETARAWSALLDPVPAPAVVVGDGGSGFAKAVREAWPRTRAQRCVLHAFCQVRRYTTARPKLLAGKELHQLARELLSIESLHQADWWVDRYMQWCEFWADFLEEKSFNEGRYGHTHERLRKARGGLSQLVNQGTLFTYLDPELTGGGPLPSTNNRLEGGVNARLRALLREHRGMSLNRRIKAVYWWCYTHTECPQDARAILETMPTDKDIDRPYELYAADRKREDGGPEWGDRAVWNEFHTQTTYPFSID